MALIEDQDRFFTGSLNFSTPGSIGQEGEVLRLLNARFIEGAITNGIGYDQIPMSFSAPDQRIFASRVTYDSLLARGDVQIVAPLQTVNSKYILAVISGILLQIDVDTGVAADITPINGFLPETSYTYPLSYMDNAGGVRGVGAYAVIFNYPNRPIFVSNEGARFSDENAYEMPPSRAGATAANRAFVVTGDTLMMASDPLGGFNPNAPLTFEETLNPAGTYYGQVFTIGSALEIDPITAVARMPVFGTASQEFLAAKLLVSTTHQKYVIAAGTPRESWESTQFITYAGSSDGIAGPLAVTNIGDVVIYMSNSGRIKNLGQDQERDVGLSETFMDETLGQYVCPSNTSFYFRDWYRLLDHSRAQVKFNRDRIYATVYPMKARAIGKYGAKYYSPTFRAMAVGSLNPTTRLGATASIAWEGFYDWLQPVGIVILGEDVYVMSKNEEGRLALYKENEAKVDTHKSTIYTRGYFYGAPGKSKGVTRGDMFFRVLAGPVNVKIYAMINNVWKLASDCMVTNKLHSFSISGAVPATQRTNSWSIPLRIEIEHNGCRFELESIRVEGEDHRKTTTVCAS